MADHVQRTLEREFLRLRSEFNQATKRREAAVDAVEAAEASLDDLAHRRDEVARALDGMDPDWRGDPGVMAAAKEALRREMSHARA